MNVLEEYNKVFMETFQLSEEELNENVEIKKIADWDSVGHIRLITSIEDAFDIMFEMEDILNFTSYEGGKVILEKYGVKI